MDKTALVSNDIETASEILEILDRGRVTVKVALWAYLSEYEEWRIVLSSRQFDTLGPLNTYGLINETLDAANFPYERKPPIVIISMTDPFIKALRKKYSKHKSVMGIGLGLQTFGNRFLEDGYALRIQ
jgi:hypothetical protein